MLVLLVNVDYRVRKNLQYSFSLQGSDIFHVASCATAISISKSFKVDLIILGKESYDGEFYNLEMAIKTLLVKPKLLNIQNNVEKSDEIRLINSFDPNLIPELEIEGLFPLYTSLDVEKEILM